MVKKIVKVAEKALTVRLIKINSGHIMKLSRTNYMRIIIQKMKMLLF